MNYFLTMSMKLSDCYRILNVSPGVKWEKIRKSYYALAKRYHPDLHPGNPDYEHRFKEITFAFKILEAHYKARDRKAAVPVVAGDRPEEENPVEIVPFDTPRVDLPDHLVEPLPPAGLWSTFFQRLKQVLLDSERKIFLLDVHKDVRIDPRTAARGGLIRVRRGKESFQVKIPSGAWNRMSLRIPQKGEASLFGSKRGDLFLNILVTRGARVSAEDLMFFYDLQVARERVTEGRVLTLNSVQGPIKFILPRTTADGQTFVLKSQPDSLDQGAVSHVVTVHLV